MSSIPSPRSPATPKPIPSTLATAFDDALLLVVAVAAVVVVVEDPVGVKVVVEAVLPEPVAVPLELALLELVHPSTLYSTQVVL